VQGPAFKFVNFQLLFKSKKAI